MILMDSLQVILTIACTKDMEIHQIDIVSTYIMSYLREQIYMCPPEGLDLPKQLGPTFIMGIIWFKTVGMSMV